MLKRFVGYNLGIHDKIDVSFTNGINTVVGSSGTGKSCLVRGIVNLYFNLMSTKSVRKEGTKETRLIAYVDDYEVEKILSDKDNSYIIRKGNEETRFDSINKTIPQEVKNVLKTSDLSVDGETINLNYDDQDDARFLIHKSYKPTFNAKLFNILTGNEVQDILFKELNKDSFNLVRKQKNEEEEITLLEKKKEDLSRDLKEKDQLYQVKSLILKKIKVKFEKYNTYLQLYQRFTKNTELIKKTKEELDSIKVIDNKRLTILETKINDLSTFKTLYNRYSKAQTQKDMVEAELKKIVVKTVDFDEISDKIERLERAKKLLKRYNDSKNAINSIKKEISDAENSIKELDNEYNETVKKLGLCDKCPFK